MTEKKLKVTIFLFFKGHAAVKRLMSPASILGTNRTSYSFSAA